MFLNNRHYDPTTAVFLSVDPLVQTTFEPYVYGAANPVTYSDPSGLDPDTAAWVRSRVQASGGCTYSSGYGCFENKYVTGIHTKVRGNQRSVAQRRYEGASMGYGAAPLVITRDFSSAGEALRALDGLVKFGGPFVAGSAEGSNNLTTTVSGYRRANGTYVLSYTRYSAGVADLGSSFTRAGNLKMVTRSAGRAFLVLDAGVTAFSSYRASEGRSEFYRVSYTSVKTASTVAGAAGGAYAGGKGGAAVGCLAGPWGCAIGGFLGGFGGTVLGAWAAGEVADEVWEFGYEKISG